MSVRANPKRFHSYSAVLVRVLGNMTDAPTGPREWDPEGFEAALEKAEMTKQELVIGLSQWLTPDRVPSLSSVYRWGAPKSSGPPYFMLPLICWELKCDVDKITKPVKLRRNPFENEEELRGAESRSKKSRRTTG